MPVKITNTRDRDTCSADFSIVGELDGIVRILHEGFPIICDIQFGGECLTGVSLSRNVCDGGGIDTGFVNITKRVYRKYYSKSSCVGKIRSIPQSKSHKSCNTSSRIIDREINSIEFIHI